MGAERLQKILSAAGIASRRAAEEVILEGRVTVNGKRVTELGAKADLQKDHVKVDGKLVRVPTVHRYVLMNKPKGYITTKDDPDRRPTVFSLLSGRVGEHVVPVGRLDLDSEGLLILTDDGALVQKLTHPSGGCRKEYEVKVSGLPTPEKLEKLARGVVLDEGVRTAPAELELIKVTPEREGAGGNAWVRVILGEGRSRQIRKMLASVGHPVSKLRRVAIGPIRDKHLKPGGFRDLTEAEVKALYAIPKAVRGAPPPPRTPLRRSAPRPGPSAAGGPPRRPAPGAPPRKGGPRGRS